MRFLGFGRRRTPVATPVDDPYNINVSQSIKSSILTYQKQAKIISQDLAAGINKSKEIYTHMDEQITLLTTKDNSIIEANTKMEVALNSILTDIQDSKQSIKNLAWTLHSLIPTFLKAADLNITTSEVAVERLVDSLPGIEKMSNDALVELNSIKTKLKNFKSEVKGFEMEKEDMFALNELLKQYIEPHIKESDKHFTAIENHKKALLKIRNQGLKKMMGGTYSGDKKR